MVVCPYCRWSNPEQTAVCLHCGAVLPSASPPPYAALVMTILAQSADWASQEKRRLRAAMVLNIISSCLLPLVVLLFFALLIGSLAAY